MKFIKEIRGKRDEFIERIQHIFFAVNAMGDEQKQASLLSSIWLTNALMLQDFRKLKRFTYYIFSYSYGWFSRPADCDAFYSFCLLITNDWMKTVQFVFFQLAMFNDIVIVNTNGCIYYVLCGNMFQII